MKLGKELEGKSLSWSGFVFSGMVRVTDRPRDDGVFRSLMPLKSSCASTSSVSCAPGTTWCCIKGGPGRDVIRKNHAKTCKNMQHDSFKNYTVMFLRKGLELTLREHPCCSHETRRLKRVYHGLPIDVGFMMSHSIVPLQPQVFCFSEFSHLQVSEQTCSLLRLPWGWPWEAVRSFHWISLVFERMHGTSTYYIYIYVYIYTYVIWFNIVMMLYG